MGAELRHASLLKDMLTAMKTNTFKRLTHRSQGGGNGLPKLKSHKQVLAAVTKIVANNGTGKGETKQAKKEKKAAKKVPTARAAAAVHVAMAPAEAESSDDDSGTDEDDPLTPVVLSTATRVGRTPGPGYTPPQTVPGEQRQHCSYNAMGAV